MSNQANLPLVLPGLQSSACYDEAYGPDGQIRSHWANFMAHYQMLASGGIQQRIERARQLAADAGISLGYGVGASLDTGGRGEQEWLFDLLPLILDVEEWAYLSAAVAQRARVLDLLLADLYGPQDTMRRGLFPPYLVYGHPGYQRSARACADENDCGSSGDRAVWPPRWLHAYAVDLVRRPDGVWTIVADKTQVPAGPGYALANRRILARAMPEAFMNQHVRSCRPFFDEWAAGLKRLAPDGRMNPRVALMTAGPFAPGYFEHVYLAREMELTLVEGADLTVRGDQVLLKEMGGLEPVDVLLRRLDGSYCDPLELRPDSLLGVTGLLNMQRRGRVALANPIGTGVVESPALFPFMPRLCQELLGEAQLAVSAETWWCGQPDILERVLSRIEDYTILPSFYSHGRPLDPVLMSPSERTTLVEDMRRWPERFVAQERLVPSEMPMLSGAALTSGAVVLRLFAVAGEQGYTVMPGGVARIPVNGSPFSGILADGSITKDVWVLSDGAAPSVQYPLPVTLKSVSLVRSTGGLQSRVADDLFWLGRYMERIEVAARLLRAVYGRLLNAEEGSSELAELEHLTPIFWRMGLVEWDQPLLPDKGDRLAGPLTAIISAGGSIDNDFSQMQRLMMGLRDRLSNDMWDVLSDFAQETHDRLQHAAGNIDLCLHAFDAVIHRSGAFAGMAAEGMVRGAGWRFMECGRRLERALFALRVASACCGYGLDPDAMFLRLALELGDAMITYRNRYLSLLQPRAVLDLLLNDDTNPKSALYQVRALQEHVSRFPERRSIDPTALLDRIAGDLQTMVDLFQIDEAGHVGSEQATAELDRLVFESETALHDLAAQLASAYFLHREGERLLRADWRP